MAMLSSSTAESPTFVADLSGSYVAQLIVSDGETDSAADTVTITANNTAPTADAGPDQTVGQGDTATLDGSGSSRIPIYNISLKIHKKKFFNYALLVAIKYNMCHTFLKK
jgi:hypothetical protein